MKTCDFKKKVADVFAENPDATSSVWIKRINNIIIGLIVVSTLGVFLSTFAVLKRYSYVFSIIEVVTVVCFTIEIILRIWTADLLDEKYKGFMGRLRYCCSFYGFVDLVSVVPFYINLFLPTPSTSLRIMRVFRFMRLFHNMKSSRLLFNAISSKKNELTITLSFLTLLTVILSVLLYFVEHEAQPDQCENGWQTFVWAFAKYLGDPGKIADFTLQTPAANFIAFIVGILGVAIFAVPTGIISSGITEALEDRKREEELNEYRHRMQKVFRRQVNKTLRGYLDTLPDKGGKNLSTLNFVPQRIPLSRIQIRQGMEMKDIFDVCQKFPEFRMKNLAEAISSEEHPQENFVVEHCPKNRPYGCAIDRNSKVTIVSTSSFTENGTGWFTYYLAKLGGFNYISKDVEVDPDELDSFFNISDEPLYDKKTRKYYEEKHDKKALSIIDQKEENRNAFFEDLKKMVSGEDSWVILFAAHIKSSMNKSDFHFADAKKDGSDSTVRQPKVYQNLLGQLSGMLQKDYALTSDLHSQRFALNKKNLGYRLQEKNIVCSSFAIRPSCDIINFVNHRLLIAYRIAMVISQQLDGGRGIQPDDVKDFKDTCFGYMQHKS